jgi:hypothetical protein
MIGDASWEPKRRRAWALNINISLEQAQVCLPKADIFMAKPNYFQTALAMG